MQTEEPNPRSRGMMEQCWQVSQMILRMGGAVKSAPLSLAPRRET